MKLLLLTILISISTQSFATDFCANLIGNEKNKITSTHPYLLHKTRSNYLMDILGAGELVPRKSDDNRGMGGDPTSVYFTPVTAFNSRDLINEPIFIFSTERLLQRNDYYVNQNTTAKGVYDPYTKSWGSEVYSYQPGSILELLNKKGDLDSSEFLFSNSVPLNSFAVALILPKSRASKDIIKLMKDNKLDEQIQVIMSDYIDVEQLAQLNPKTKIANIESYKAQHHFIKNDPISKVTHPKDALKYLSENPSYIHNILISAIAYDHMPASFFEIDPKGLLEILKIISSNTTFRAQLFIDYVRKIESHINDKNQLRSLVNNFIYLPNRRSAVFAGYHEKLINRLKSKDEHSLLTHFLEYNTEEKFFSSDNTMILSPLPEWVF